MISIIKDHLTPMEPLQTDAGERLEKVSGIKAVLFDVYGTLLISVGGDISLADSDSISADKILAAESALQKSGFSLEKDGAGEKAVKFFREEIDNEHSRLKGAGIDFPEVDIRDIWSTLLQRLKKDGAISGKIDKAACSIVALRFELETNKIWPMPGAEKVLDYFSFSGIPLGIVSNAQFYTPLTFRAVFSRSDIELGFDPSLIAYSYLLHRSKPSLEVFRPVLEELERKRGIMAHEVLYVGNDMRNDIYTAQKNGCRTILFAGDQRSLRLRENSPECQGLAPDAVVTSLEQIPSLAGISS